MNDKSVISQIWPSSPKVSLRVVFKEERIPDISIIDPDLDRISDDYLRRYAPGLSFIDNLSWLFYAPYFMCHAIRNFEDKSDVAISEFLSSLELVKFNEDRLRKLSCVQLEMIIWFLQCLQKKDFSYYVEDLLDNLRGC